MNWLRAFRPRLFQQIRGRVDIEHLEMPDPYPTPAEVAERNDLTAVVLEALAALPSKYRVPLTMFPPQRRLVSDGG